MRGGGILNRAARRPPLDIKRMTGDWHVQIKAKSALDLAVQRIVFLPGGQSGWHTHPGPVFIQVISGTMTFYESDDPTCTPIVRTVGQGYLDLGEHAVNVAKSASGTGRPNNGYRGHSLLPPAGPTRYHLDARQRDRWISWDLPFPESVRSVGEIHAHHLPG